MMLAQITPDLAKDTAAFLVGLGALLWIYNQWMEANDRRENKKTQLEQPIEVRQAHDGVTRGEFARHADENRHEHENLFRKIGGVERGVQERMTNALIVADGKLAEAIRSGNESREKLHDRINQVLAAVSELKGKVESQ